MIAVSFLIPEDWAAGETVFGEVSVWKAAADIFFFSVFDSSLSLWIKQWMKLIWKQEEAIFVAAELVQHEFWQDEVMI